MKSIENKKHRHAYYPINLNKIDVSIFCDVGLDDNYTITKHLPLTCINNGSLTKNGATIVVGTISISAKYFKDIRKRRW